MPDKTIMTLRNVFEANASAHHVATVRVDTSDVENKNVSVSKAV
jgi:hypothetical protein